MRAPNKEILVEAIRNLQNQHYTIHAKWDAGGDETPCYIYYFNDQQKEWKYEYQGIDIMSLLRNLIIDKLDLPNAGDVYNKGFGFISINDKDEIIISYTARNYYVEDWDRKDLNHKIVDLPDEYNLTMYLHRTRIHFEATLDEEMNFDFSMRVRIIEGDELPISQACHDWYQDFFRKRLIKYESEFDSLIKQKKGLLISIDADLTNKNEIDGSLQEEYREIIYNRKDYHEILI